MQFKKKKVWQSIICWLCTSGKLSSRCSEHTAKFVENEGNRNRIEIFQFLKLPTECCWKWEAISLIIDIFPIDISTICLVYTFFLFCFLLHTFQFRVVINLTIVLLLLPYMPVDKTWLLKYNKSKVIWGVRSLNS